MTNKGNKQLVLRQTQYTEIITEGRNEEERLALKKLTTLTTDFRSFFTSMKKTVNVISGIIDEDEHLKEMVDLKYMKLVEDKDKEIERLKKQIEELQQKQQDNQMIEENEKQLDDEEMKKIIDELD